MDEGKEHQTDRIQRLLEDYLVYQLTDEENQPFQ